MTDTMVDFIIDGRRVGALPNHYVGRLWQHVAGATINLDDLSADSDAKSKVLDFVLFGAEVATDTAEAGRLLAVLYGVS